jgi:hypothetical protein
VENIDTIASTNHSVEMMRLRQHWAQHYAWYSANLSDRGRQLSQWSSASVLQPKVRRF